MTISAASPAAQARFAFVRKTTRELLDANGLTHWSILIQEHHRRAGWCNFTTETLGFEPNWLLAVSEDEILEVIYHELAHALLPAAERHGKLWRAKVRELGGTPKVSQDAVRKTIPAGTYLWIGTCPGCGHQVGMKRVPQVVYSCSMCCSNGKFNPSFIFRWAKRGVAVEAEALNPRYRERYLRTMERAAALAD